MMQEQLDRIEAKLDQLNVALGALLDALDEDPEEDTPQFDLDGNLLAGSRAPGESL